MRSRPPPRPPRANPVICSARGSIFSALAAGSIIISALIAALLPKASAARSRAIMVIVLMTLINQPHFAHSYQIFYRNFRERRSASVQSPICARVTSSPASPCRVALAVFFAVAVLTDNPRLLGFGANIMFFTVGWHYVKQGYGILIVDSAQKRIPLSQRSEIHAARSTVMPRGSCRG